MRDQKTNENRTIVLNEKEHVDKAGAFEKNFILLQVVLDRAKGNIFFFFSFFSSFYNFFFFFLFFFLIGIRRANENFLFFFVFFFSNEISTMFLKRKKTSDKELAVLADCQIHERTFQKGKRECQMRPNGRAASKGFGLWRVAYDKANEKRILFLKGKKNVDKTAALEGL